MKYGTMVLLAVTALVGFPVQALSDTVDLATAGNFAVMGSTQVTNTGTTNLNNGNLGLSPGTSYPVSGINYSGTFGALQDTGVGAAANARADLTAAYSVAAGLAPTSTNDYTTFNSGDLNGLTLTPGVYFFSSTALLSVGGLLQLDFEGDANALFVFQVGSALTAVSGSEVRAIDFGSGTAAGCNVFWQVTSSAGIGTDATFLGHILALSDITLGHGAIVNGSALARNGQVTMDANTINNLICGDDDDDDDGDGVAVVPLPSAAALGLGLLPLAWLARRRAVRRREAS